MKKLKYDINKEYVFECEIASKGIFSKEIENNLTTLLKKTIKENNLIFASLSNEENDKADIDFKIFSLIEELQIIKNCKVLYVGRIDDHVIKEIVNEMKENNELNKKREFNLKNCIIIILEKEDGKAISLIINRKGFYHISKKITNKLSS
jgi:hypothetical protein